VPCAGKKPVLPGWNKERLTEAELDAALQGTNHNIAIALNLSELIDVECDTDEAESNLQAMFGGQVPPTPTWRSKRGLHRLFRRPPGLPERAVVKLDGIEFRIGNDKGALSIVPPSVHPDGPRYEWLPGLSIHDVGTAELPKTIATRLEQAPKFANGANMTPEGEGIKEGDRNSSLFKIACKLARSGLTPASVEAALQSENQGQCLPPLERAEVAAIAKSACTQHSQSTQTNAEILLGIALADSELWHTSDAAYATIRRDGHREHWPLRSKGFRQWLAKLFYDAEKKAVGSQTMQDVLGVLEGKATFEGPTYARCLRVAEHEGRIYIDLADDAWRAIEVDAVGWRIIDDPPVRFCRPARILPLPVPARDGSLALLRRFVNVVDEHWPLVLGWLAISLRPTGPYPILRTKGEQGSAKTTQARVLRSLVDPSDCPTRGAPGSERDLMIAAENGWVCAFDNLSHLTPELSDALCRLSSGGGFGVRTHYENAEETVFHSARPIIINGIEDVGTRSDLMDRSLIVELPRLANEARMPEKVFDCEFEKVRQRIFGGLLTALSMALKNLPAVEQSKTAWPRMADFAQWVVAAEPALGLERGAFLQAYLSNRETANQTALESSPVVAAIMVSLNRTGGMFRGTATQLHSTISFGQDTRAKSWPKNARALSGVLERLAPNLRQSGLIVEHERDGNNKVWRIEITPKATETLAAVYASSQSSQISDELLAKMVQRLAEKTRA
jgi:hypothetical protein